MSIINQMLKDLDSRCGPANGAQLAVLQGLGLVNTNPIQWPRSLTILGWSLGGVLLAIIGFQTASWWLDKSGSTQEPVPAVQLSSPDNTLSETATVTNTEAEVSTVVQLESSEAQHEQTDEPEVRETRAPATGPDKVTPGPIKTLTPKQKAEHAFSMAQQALTAHQPQRGERLLRDTLNEFPGHASARTQLAALLVNRQQTDKAELLLADGLVTDPYNHDLARPYAQLLATRDALTPALEALDRAINQGRTDAESMALRAALLYRMNRPAESATSYRHALNDQPHRALWWTGLAVSLEQSGESMQALAAYRRAAQLPLEKAVNDYVLQRVEQLRHTEPLN